jgi:hypothetical protein
VLKLRAQQRLRPLLRSGAESYRYEPDVEEFLRRSPSVRSVPDPRTDRDPPASPVKPSYDELTADEVIGLAASLEARALAELRRYEAANQSRSQVLAALDRGLAGKPPPG